MWEEWVVISWGLAKTGAACVAKLVVWIGGGLGSRIVKGVGASLICVILTGVALGVREGLVSGEDNGWRDVGYAGSGRGLSVSGRVGVGKIRVLEWVCGVAHIVVVCYGVWVGTGLASGGLFDIRRVSGLGEEVSWCGCSIGVGLWRGFCIGSVGVFGGEGWKMGVIVLDVGESRCFGRVWSVAALVVGFEPMGDGGGGGGVRKEERSLINTSFLDEYECSSLALEWEGRDEKKRLDHLKQDLRMERIYRQGILQRSSGGVPFSYKGVAAFKGAATRLRFCFCLFVVKVVSVL
ncbi:hypothetical protein Tco_0486734 [Tanacetum coccineum]